LFSIRLARIFPWKAVSLEAVSFLEPLRWYIYWLARSQRTSQRGGTSRDFAAIVGQTKPNDSEMHSRASA
jgi:hypothetical protein